MKSARKDSLHTRIMPEKGRYKSGNHGVDKGSNVSSSTSSAKAVVEKTKNKKANPPQSSSSASKESTEASVTARPDTRTLIGGASWTGKLPVNLLSEICQKQRWERPDYSMVYL